MTVYSKQSMEKEKMNPLLDRQTHDLTNDRYAIDFEDRVKPSNSVEQI